MPKINVYLPDDLADAVRDTGVPVSAICQRALEQAVRRITAIRQISLTDLSDADLAGQLSGLHRPGGDRADPGPGLRDLGA